MLLDLLSESRYVDRLRRDLVIHPRARLAEIGEADAERDQRRELARLIAARRDPGLMERAPEAVAGVGIVVPECGRARRGGGADEDEAEVGTEEVREAVGRVRRQGKSARKPNVASQSALRRVTSG